MSQAALDSFGKKLIESGRNQTIEQWDDILSGRLKGERAARIRKSIEKQQIAVIQKLIPEIVDSVLHNILFMLEEQKGIKVVVSSSRGTEIDIKEVSDGLAVRWRRPLGRSRPGGRFS